MRPTDISSKIEDAAGTRIYQEQTPAALRQMGARTAPRLARPTARGRHHAGGERPPRGEGGAAPLPARGRGAEELARVLRVHEWAGACVRESAHATEAAGAQTPLPQPGSRRIASRAR
jgi:hypothetical protein